MIYDIVHRMVHNEKVPEYNHSKSTIAEMFHNHKSFPDVMAFFACSNAFNAAAMGLYKKRFTKNPSGLSYYCLFALSATTAYGLLTVSRNFYFEKQKKD